MPNAVVVGIDSAGGGLVTGGGQTFVTFDGSALAIVTDPIAVHPPGTPPHDTATITVGSAFVTIDGQALGISGLPASCGDILTGTGPEVSS